LAESGRARERRAQGGRAIADQAEPGARSEEIVASYWQRYCGKNDTIGFFGPLAWGRIEDDAPPLSARSGGLVRSRHVHFEAWAVQALAQALDPELRIAAARTGPTPRGRLLPGDGAAAIAREVGARILTGVGLQSH
jgi:hypothetical protein